MATIQVDDDLDARLQECVRTATGATAQARYAINQPMIDRWADALRDPNPAYVDDAAAVATGRSGMIAPPTMVQAWTMPALSVMGRGMHDVPGYAPYWVPAGAAAATGEPPRNPGNAAYALLTEHGFTANAATNCRQDYHREMRVGDHITCTTTLDSITPLKRTAMGAGHFVTTRMEYADQHGDPIATQLWTILRFRPPAAGTTDQRVAAARSADAPAADPAPPDPGDPFGADLAVGQRMPQIVIPITPTFVIATAIATHDFYAIHHDTDWARSIGQPDIFTNILTTTGLVGRVVTDWAGPATRLRSVDLRLLVPNYPGDVLRLSGEVADVQGRAATISVVGRNGLGDHVRASVVADLPEPK